MTPTPAPAREYDAEADAHDSYYDAIAEIKRRREQGAPLHPMFTPRDAGKAASGEVA